jgi:cytochrome c556
MHLRIKVAAALALAGIAVAAHAQFKPEESIQYRQGIFKAQRWNLVPMAMMVQGKMPYDAQAFQMRAQRLHQLSAMAWEGFGPGTDSGAPTKARPEIWSDATGFKQAQDAFQAEAAKLATAAQSGNLDQIRPVFQGVVKTCDNCHDKFRAK